ncbi:MAG TPA: hypothetical protein VIZ65_08465 [Cellvibrionaceae bacterium]
MLISIPGFVQVFLFSLHQPNEKFWLGSLWIIVSFFIGSGIAGAVRGLPKAEVAINKQAAFISFGVAFILIIVGLFI